MVNMAIKSHLILLGFMVLCEIILRIVLSIRSIIISGINCYLRPVRIMKYFLMPQTNLFFLSAVFNLLGRINRRLKQNGLL